MRTSLLCLFTLHLVSMCVCVCAVCVIWEFSIKYYDLTAAIGNINGKTLPA